MVGWLWLAAATAAVAFANDEEELVWSSRTRSRPRLTQGQLASGNTEEAVYGRGFVPGHLGGALEQAAPPSVPGGGALAQRRLLDSEPGLHGEESGGLSPAQEAVSADSRKKDVRKQFIGGPAGLGAPLVSAGVGGVGSFGGGVGLAGVGPVIPGGAPAAFGGTASHVACGGGPCGPVPLPVPPPPPPPVPIAVQTPAVAVAQVAAVGAYASCPGGKSLEVECDAKRPWPQCPPQSYCYATNTADVGPYVCCPIWSTYGSKWRPRSAFYPYYPPMPYNWPPAIQATAGWPRQVAPAVPVPVPVPCPVPPCGGPLGPYKKKKKVLRKILKGKKRLLHKTARRTKAKAQAQN